MPDPADIVVRADRKTLAVFLDGTWNIDENNTNVWRLYSLCAKADGQGRRQLSYYTKGVGTAFGEIVRGGAFGVGIDGLIKGAYEWIVANYDEGDKLFIFGFSRGAYAARSLAGLIARCGVTRPGSPIGLGELYSRALRGEAEPTIFALAGLKPGQPVPVAGTPRPVTLFEEWMQAYCQAAEITMVGVWDTVGALRGARGYRETGLRKPIKHLFQALAIDEHRPAFAPTLWTVTKRPGSPPPFRPLASVEQRWFVGAHANVGGGYNSDLLPQLPLQWLMEKAGALGLAFRGEVDFRDTDKAHAVYGSPIADSFRDMAGGAYYALKLGRPYLRPIGAPDMQDGAATIATVNETIDRSVFERWRRNGDYRPANLRAWADRRGVAVEALVSSVLAADPSRPLGAGAEGPPLMPAPSPVPAPAPVR